ncbi:MAG TPA: hypothetical protein VMX13_17560 [Sedimentisphaerales bacterium]|nr:hypothetical protein [Sedimentisphaerales bacterium]
MDERPLFNDGLGRMTLGICILVVGGLWHCVAVTALGAAPARRAAILSSKEIRESGLSDLLTVQMQELPGVELVERDLLKSVMNEVGLFMMLGADQPENRRKAGALLKADILVLLTVEQIAEEKRIKVIISECSNGARLRVGWVLYDARYIHGACRDLMKIVRETLARFEGGVKQIVGVSYFVSRNLVHNYDHLQAGYANLLSSALSSSPGVAVIEIEEARSLRLEEELAGDMQTDRVVPLFVQGEFRVQNPGSKEQARVNMTVTISDSSGTIRQMDYNDLPMDGAAGFLTDDVRLEVLRLSRSPSLKTLDKEKQFARLVADASEFAIVGEWKYSIGMREAAVLLKPDSVAQRRKLIYEYLGVDKPRFALEHLEAMIYRHLISIGEAVTLSDKCIRRLCGVYPFGVPAKIRSCRRDFLLTAYLEILKLEPSGPEPWTQDHQRWYEFLIPQWLSCHYMHGCPTKQDLDFCLHFHEEILPEEAEPTKGFIVLLNGHCDPGWSKRCTGIHSEPLYFAKHPEHFSEQDFLDFITAMSRSKRPLPRLYGRYALLQHQYHKRLREKERMDDLCSEARSLTDEARKLEAFGVLAGAVGELLQKIEKHIRDNSDGDKGITRGARVNE